MRSYSAYSSTEHAPQGKHLILDASSVDPSLLLPSTLAPIFEDAIRSTGATILRSSIHYFDPQGVTITLVLAESHATLHTYPEHGCYFADVFTCGDIDPLPAGTYLARVLGGSSRYSVLNRVPPERMRGR